MADQHLLDNRYEVQGILGRGGCAVTYRAIDTRTGDACAIKCLSFRKITEWKTWELFEREARILKNLNHPRIPRYIDFFTQETDQDIELYLVQAYVEGQSLAQLVQEGRHFSEAEARRLALKLCDLLEYLHHLSPPIVHRDIKPGNILLDADNRLFLIDFGAVKDTIMADYAASSGAPTVVGTYGYMPLEQIEGRALPQSDLYALGMTLISILSHKEPIDIEKTGLESDFRPHVNISADFAEVIAKLIAPDWQQRYQNAAEVKADLARLEQQRPIRRAAKIPQFQSRAVAIMIILEVLLISGVLGYVFFRRPFSQEPPPPVLLDDRPALREHTPIPALTPDESAVIDEFTEPTLTPLAMIPEPTPTPIETIPEPTPTQPETIPEPTPTPVEILTGPVLRGRLVFDDRPITAITTLEPDFWFRNEDTGQEQAARVTYQDGEFSIYGLPSGNFGISVNLDANSRNPWSYPGDYRAWQPFTVQTGANPELVVPLLKIIRLLAPQDNNAVMDKWEAECLEKITFHSPVTFAWEALSHDAIYAYEITRMDCANNYNSAGTVSTGTTTDTRISKDLPPSLNNECYGFHLYARHNDERIGMVMTHGANGYGWDYRFRVR